MPLCVLTWNFRRCLPQRGRLSRRAPSALLEFCCREDVKMWCRVFPTLGHLGSVSDGQTGGGAGVGKGKRSQGEGVPRQGSVDQLRLSHGTGVRWVSHQCMMAPQGLKECDFPHVQGSINFS